jgi:hypothetical protein
VIYDLIDLKMGNLAVTDIQHDRWGHTLTVECLYSYPPEEKMFKLAFNNCRSIQWYVLRDAAEAKGVSSAQLLTHDLGQPNYQRTARIATVLVDLIILYETLEVQKDW